MFKTSLFLSLSILFLAIAPARAQEGFKPLFNGRDLTGWRYDNKPYGLKEPPREDLTGKTKTSDGRFEFIDGVLHFKKASGKAQFDISGNTSLYWNTPLKENFILKLEFRCKVNPELVTKKENSGLYFGKSQLQIDAETENGQTGVFKGLTKFKRDDWNELEIVVKNAAGFVVCNGEKAPAGRAHVDFLNKGNLLGIQNERGPFEFRNVRIKMEP